MTQNYTAVIQKDEGWWIGWIQEIPGVNGQERTKDELLESLRITLLEMIEDNRKEAICRTEGNLLRKLQSRYEVVRLGGKYAETPKQIPPAKTPHLPMSEEN